MLVNDGFHNGRRHDRRLPFPEVWEVSELALQLRCDKADVLMEEEEARKAFFS